MQIGIIGSGIAGLASAVRMAARGHKVTVFEANAYPGGKLSQFEQDGYRFDAGPSLFTMPHYVDELFALAGENPRQSFNYQRLDTVCQYFWSDGTRFSAKAELNQLADDMADVFGVSPASIHDYFADSARKYQASGRIFLEKSLHRLSTWLHPSVLKALPHLPRFDLLTSMHRVNQRRLAHPKLVQLFDRFATYNGSNPYRTPGLLTIIPHFEHEIGAFLPEQGMHDITEQVYQLALRLGVQFHFSTPVERILHQNRQAQGLLVAGQAHHFDRVITNADVFFTYQKLLPDIKPPAWRLRQERSTSALIFYWGVRQKFPELDVHNIFFSDDYRQEFNALEAGHINEDPTIYVNITSKHVAGEAPPNGENWFVMINAPANQGQDWSSMISGIRQRTLNKLGQQLGVNLASLIETEAILDPLMIEQKTSSFAGALYGTSSNARLAAFARHPNFHSKLKGLYFVGGSAHPGGGIPLCLLSAKIVDELMHGPQPTHCPTPDPIFRPEKVEI